MGAAHWVYLSGIVLIIAVMIARKNVVIPAIAATFLTAWTFTGSFVKGLESIFNASLTSASELFNIFLIIALVTALLGALRALGADRRMVEPFRLVMRSGHSAFWVLAFVTYAISLFFWPTPAVPLMGAILLPAAIAAGLPPIAAALAIAVAGQGMALSSDYVIQVAPGLSAKAANVSTDAVADKAMVLSLITGGVALFLGYLMTRSQYREPDALLLERWEAGETEAAAPVARRSFIPGLPLRRRILQPAPVPATTTTAEGDASVAVLDPGPGSGSGSGASAGSVTVPAPRNGDGPASGTRNRGLGRSGGEPGDAMAAAALKSLNGGDLPGDDCPKRSKAFAAIIPLALVGLVGYMMLGKFTDAVPEVVGGDAAALVGGVTVALLLAAAVARDAGNALQACADHIVDGLVFAVRAMGVVIPIAGFFFIGNADFAGKIMSLGDGAKAPGFLFESVTHMEGAIPDSRYVVGFGVLLIGMITGLDGSGFAGLPLTGSLAGTLGPTSGVDPALLAAIGQMGCVWSGGGVLIAWSSLLAVAGFARVPVMDLVRRSFLPVVAGLVVATVAGLIIF
ncbi:membrane protein [Actinomadura napierensis]|uniref:Membrane protein n=2 Tax=Actinomadura napierensis TaxID=267854 RepID=A0ABP5M8W5_9ACTN